MIHSLGRFSGGLLLTLLAGCGASSTETGNSSNPTGLTIDEPVTFLGLFDAAETLGDRLDTLEPTLETQSGTAQYRGVALVTEDVDAEGVVAIGAVSLDVDFDGQTITGSANNFFEALSNSDGDVTGVISETDGQFDLAATDTDGFIELDITGSVTFDGTTYDVDSALTGGFLGEDGADADMFVAVGEDLAVTTSDSAPAELDIAITAD